MMKNDDVIVYDSIDNSGDLYFRAYRYDTNLLCNLLVGDGVVPRADLVEFLEKYNSCNPKIVKPNETHRS